MITGEQPYTIAQSDGVTQVQCLPLEDTNDTQSFNGFNIDLQCAKEVVEKTRLLAYKTNDASYEENPKRCLGSVVGIKLNFEISFHGLSFLLFPCPNSTKNLCLKVFHVTVQ